MQCPSCGRLLRQRCFTDDARPRSFTSNTSRTLLVEMNLSSLQEVQVQVVFKQLEQFDFGLSQPLSFLSIEVLRKIFVVLSFSFKTWLEQKRCARITKWPRKIICIYLKFSLADKSENFVFTPT